MDEQNKTEETKIEIPTKFKDMIEKIEKMPGAERERALSSLVAKNKEGHAAYLSAVPENGEDFYAGYVAAATRSRNRRR